MQYLDAQVDQGKPQAALLALGEDLKLALFCHSESCSGKQSWEIATLLPRLSVYKDDTHVGVQLVDLRSGNNSGV